jgi:TonB family protein
MKAIVIGGLLIATAAIAHAGDDPLNAAKDLYASAAYEEALKTLGAIQPSDAAIGREVDLYRAYCLFALGRTGEAEQAAESLIRTDPLIELEEAGPRIDSMFLDVRKRLLPGLIRARYKAAKAAIDQKDAKAAEPHLVYTRRMLTEAERVEALDEGLADLGVLVDGFLDLVRSVAFKPEEPQAAPAAAGSVESRGEGGPSAPAPPAASNRVFGVEDEGVTPPEVLSQKLPPVPARLMRFVGAGPPAAIVEIEIDETGAVRTVTMRQSLHPAYDALVIEASRTWRYIPATKDGAAVSYRKVVMIRFDKSS